MSCSSAPTHGRLSPSTLHERRFASLSDVYHVELRQFPHNFCRFNLTERDLHEMILNAWARGDWIELGERKWSPHQASLKVIEGPELPWRSSPWVADGATPSARARTSPRTCWPVLARARTIRSRNRPPPHPGRSPILRRSPGRQAPTGLVKSRLTTHLLWNYSRCSATTRDRSCEPGSWHSSVTPTVRRANVSPSPKTSCAAELSLDCRYRLGGRSSVGRAPGCGLGGRGFESRRSPSQNTCKSYVYVQGSLASFCSARNNSRGCFALVWLGVPYPLIAFAGYSPLQTELPTASNPCSRPDTHAGSASSGANAEAPDERYRAPYTRTVFSRRPAVSRRVLAGISSRWHSGHRPFPVDQARAARSRVVRVPSTMGIPVAEGTGR